MAENVSHIDDRRHASSPPKKSYPISFANISKHELAKRDIFGRTILHVLVLTNRYDLLKRLFKNPESRLIIALTDWENGWNCLHYAVFHKRLTCLKAIMEYIKTVTIGAVASHGLFQELLRCKDRNQQTPLQLLDNEAREFFWWPEYMNESSEFHLKFRYKLIGAEGSSSPPRPRQSPTFRSHDWWDDARGGSDLFVLGANFNNNLGVGDSKDRNTPTKVMGEAFRIDDLDAQQLYKPRIRRHIISKYHSLVVTVAGELFACGIGTRGRLGHGFENMRNSYSFQRVDGEAGHIIAIDASSNHSLVLNTHGELYGWGLNSYSQLGLLSSTTSTTSSSTKRVFSEVFEPMPTQILTGDLKRLDGQLKGVAVSKVHSLVYTRHEMFSWGLCLGQMGVSPDSQSTPGEHRLNGILYKGHIQPTPKKIAIKDEIKLVGTCESCTCVVTTKSDIHIYYQFQHLKLPKISMAAGKVDDQFEFFKPAVLTQLVAIKKLRVKRHDLILFLLDNGDVVKLDDPTNAKYVTVWKARTNAMIAIDFDVGSDGSIVVCTKNGSVFVKLPVDASSGSSSGPVRKSSMSESSLGGPSKFNKFVRLDNLNKIVRVSCDDQFESLGFIRDEVDMMPMKLRKNSFVNDLMYLENFREVDLYRKQDELFKFEGPGNSYITDYLFSHHKRVNRRSNLILNVLDNEEDVLDEEDEEYADGDRQETRDIVDIYHLAHRDRYSLRHLRIKAGSTYQSVSKLERLKLSEDLKLPSPLCFLYLKNNTDRVKEVSMRLSSDGGDISIAVHDHILRARSTVFSNGVKQGADAEIRFEGLAAHYSSTKREILFTHKPNLKSLVIFVHFLYTNDTLNIWDDYTSGSTYPAEMKVIRDDFRKLTGLFAIADIYGNLTRNDAYLKKMVTMVDDNGADLKVHLSDGFVHCHSAILMARSAFFETMLSNRWDLASIKSLDFEDIKKSQFEIILRHMYGVSDLQLFDVLIRACQTDDQFVNELLDLIEIADGMVLFDLKLLCELAVKDFITLDNVLVLVQHSDALLSKKLLLSCCWLIYNNLEVLLLDPAFKDLNLEILRKVEKQLLFLSRCKDRCLMHDERTNSVLGELSKPKDDWFQSNSTQLVSSFLNDMDDFNGNFLAGKRTFAPLVDLKREKKKRSVSLDKPKGVGTDSVSLSFGNAGNALAGLAAFKADIDGMHSSSTAIDDDDNENDFEDVSRRGGKPLISLRKTLVILGPPISSGGNVVSRTTKNSFSEERRVSVPGLSPHSTWGSHLPLSTKDQPVLGVDSDRKTKAKVVLAPRLSQKERKRQLAQAQDSSIMGTSAPLISRAAPWASQSTNSSSTPLKCVGPKANTIIHTGGTKTTTPRLNSKATEVTRSSTSSPSPSSPYLQQKSSSSSSLSSSTTTNLNGASLTAIMLQESMKSELQQLKEKERISLQEIQQEQEFERWWHQETLKLQKETKKRGPKAKAASRRTTK